MRILGNVNRIRSGQGTQSNLRKHGVSFSHAEQALRDPNALTVEDPDSRFEQRQITLGMDSLGRLIIVVHTQRDERTRLISARKASPGEAARTMRDEYDFSKAKRGAIIKSPGKTRITIMLDRDLIEYFRARAEAEGIGYQTMVNAVLRDAVVNANQKAKDKPLTVATLRKVLREVLDPS